MITPRDVPMSAETRTKLEIIRRHVEIARRRGYRRGFLAACGVWLGVVGLLWWGLRG